MQKKWLLIVLLLAVSSATVAAPSDDTVLDAHRRVFVQNAHAGNAAAIAAEYAEDAMLLPPNAAAVRGRAAIQQFWSGFLASGAIDLKLTPVRVVHSCDLASEVGQYDVTITPKSGAPIHDVGKYVITFHKTGGDWRAISDIFNSDLPPPPR